MARKDLARISLAVGFKKLSVCMGRHQRATIGVYCRIAAFYLIYEYLVCDQVHMIMQDAYLQIGVMHFSNAMDT
ncbi:hypothetical protein T10_10777 [Trichinella papuae]|uniref:Uncharacterized protein n=1 Tax=Trichinella papuae TaxID=268474 RepID=A0A0V1N7N6_9BILA|nr:hypothetical protein T10_10777 [Trichinella papuae]